VHVSGGEQLAGRLYRQPLQALVGLRRVAQQRHLPLGEHLPLRQLQLHEPGRRLLACGDGGGGGGVSLVPRL